MEDFQHDQSVIPIDPVIGDTDPFSPSFDRISYDLEYDDQPYTQVDSPLKTRQHWEESGLHLHQYLIEPCEIDEAMYKYIAEIVPPAYSVGGLIQGGDPLRTDRRFDEDDILYYDTVSLVGNKFFYLGVLPDFKQ